MILVLRKMPLAIAALVGVCHSGDYEKNEKLDEIVHLENYWKQIDPYLNESFRLFLLIGTLRLCDELDATYLRLLKPERISNWRVNDESKKHWLACLFIEICNIQIQKYSAYREVFVEYGLHKPESLGLEDWTLIKDFINKFRIDNLKKEVKFIKDMYKAVDANYQLYLNIRPFSSKIEIYRFKIPQSYLKIIKKALEEKRNSIKRIFS